MTEQMLNGTTHSIAFITGRSKILITHHSETLQLRKEDVQSLQLVPHIFPIWFSVKNKCALVKLRCYLLTVLTT